MAVNTGPSVLSSPPLSLLSLDGGGIRGVSEPLILDEIMKRIQTHQGLPDTPKPCEYFDLIGGTGTGGLIAIMLGRLKRSTAEALRSYNNLSRVVFQARKPFDRHGKFKATALEKEMKEVIVQAGYNDDQKLLDPNAGKHSRGNVFVCSMTRVNLHSPQRFRTYRGLPNQGPDCMIWEAVRATTAGLNVFKPIKITGPGGFSVDYVGASLEFNNPTQQVRDEAKKLFGNDRRIGVLVSIGTGHTSPHGFRQWNRMERALPSELINVLQSIATDCERVADEVAKEYDNDDIYFRFNILHGAGGIPFDEWKKMNELSAHTTSYLRGPEVSKQIDRVVACLCRIQKEWKEWNLVNRHDSSTMCSEMDQFTIPTVDRFSIKLLKQISIGNDYRFHSASHNGKVVAVKIFEGENAAQVWWLSICPRRQV
ncbi:acyl transferase/acyl hydrolase/lysophospholipase [Desarmillaria tabescens]|uniref:Acyl transferase/acyl hydrolase/lysophospholipase n=1 Tax=Armillaria tabescens TaxID=1929756 RepID=A0AA39NQG3_ARMTA|nr:acyl transferase/acyl hydrolase/lysophospholipase [Desarmillaria tabescens]KAK0469967.1 acyl transferase/acyl hydrolase/lysophospholipase [Desarmillaria tabescens]